MKLIKTKGLALFKLYFFQTSDYNIKEGIFTLQKLNDND